MKRFQRLFQIATAVLYNLSVQGFATGIIYQGIFKRIPCPGLNCYSCPGAVMACPIGALQLLVAYGRAHISLYVIGCLSLAGSLIGRMVCGWGCPFGLLQDLMHKIPSRKFAIHRSVQHLRYAVLFIVIGAIAYVTQEPWFCKLCPAGTLTAGIPLLSVHEYLREQIGMLFYVKMALLAGCLVWMILSKRPFCRTLCPLGAFYSMFNRISMVRIDVDPQRCTRCGVCLKDCPMDLTLEQGGASSDQCIRCFRCTSCPAHAVKITWFR